MTQTGQTDQQILETLFRYGHAENPSHDNARNIRAGDLPQLRLTDRDAADMVQSYQEFFAETLDELTLKHHRRAASIPDGEVGPATRELLAMPRCGVPEFAGEAVEANWPKSCRNNLRTKYTMQLPGISDGQLHELWDEMQRNWMGACPDIKLELTPDRGDLEVEIFAKGQRLPGSTLAWSHLARSNCRVTLEQRYDTGIRWDARTFVTTATHEVGHALGHQHVNDGQALMYPIITAASKSRRGFPNATDLRQADRLGYLVAADPQPLPKKRAPDEPPPPLPLPPRGDWPVIIGGEVMLRIGDQSRPYVLVPKPQT